MDGPLYHARCVQMYQGEFFPTPRDSPVSNPRRNDLWVSSWGHRDRTLRSFIQIQIQLVLQQPTN